MNNKTETKDFEKKEEVKETENKEIGAVNFSDVEYVQVDKEKNKILCIKNVSERENELTGVALPILDYSEKTYRKIIRKMKQIEKIEKIHNVVECEKEKVQEATECNNEIDEMNKIVMNSTRGKEKFKHIKVTYKNDKNPKYFESKCEKTLDEIHENQIKNRNNTKAMYVGLTAVTICTTLVASMIANSTLEKKSPYENKPVDFDKDKNISMNIDDENKPIEPITNEDLFEKMVDSLYDNIVYKHNRIPEKEVLLNIIKGLNGDYSYESHLDREMMIGKVLNELAIMIDNNMENPSQFVSLGHYVTLKNNNELILRSESISKNVCENIDKDNFAIMKNDALKETIHVLQSDEYQNADSLVKLYSSMVLDQLRAKTFNGNESYEENDKKYSYSDLNEYLISIHQQAIYEYSNNVIYTNDQIDECVKK